MIIFNCKFLLTTLENVRVVFVRRSTNVVAHLLSRKDHSYRGRFVSGINLPTCTLSIVSDEMK